jgi:hypothetical protein
VGHHILHDMRLSNRATHAGRLMCQTCSAGYSTRNDAIRFPCQCQEHFGTFTGLARNWNGRCRLRDYWTSAHDSSGMAAHLPREPESRWRRGLHRRRPADALNSYDHSVLP